MSSIGIQTFVDSTQNNEDWVLPFQLSTYDPVSNTRSPVNLVGVEMKGLLVGASSGIPSLPLSTTAGTISIGSSGSSGDFTIKVPAASMWTLPEGVYTGDILMFLAGTVELVMNINLTVIAGNTPPIP